MPASASGPEEILEKIQARCAPLMFGQYQRLDGIGADSRQKQYLFDGRRDLDVTEGRGGPAQLDRFSVFISDISAGF